MAIALWNMGFGPIFVILSAVEKKVASIGFFTIFRNN